MKRKITALLLFAAMAMQLAACGSGSNDSGTTTPAAQNSDTEPVVTGPTLEVPQSDFGGKKFTILSTVHAEYEYVAEEMTGDVVSDAVYNRNKQVEDLLNISLEIITQPGHWADRDSFNHLVTASVMAQDGAYDLVNGATVCVLPIAADGIFINAADLEYVNLDNPWWVQGMMDNLAVNGKLYGFIGDASLSLYKDLAVVFFNKQLAEDYKIENPYELVRSGKWTVDKLNECITGVSNDLNGDGKLALGDDLIGLLSEPVANRAFLTSTKMDVVTFENGTPTIVGLTERTSDIYARLYKLFVENESQLCGSENKRTEQSQYFSENKALFMNTLLNVTDYLRNMQSDFGILPYPKYNEDQENYYTQIGTSTSMMFVPVTTNDAELTSMVCEAMSYYGQKGVVPAYYEVALKEKYTRDEEVKEMLDIIRSGAQMDFNFAYSTMFTPFTNCSTEFRDKNNTPENLASYFATNVPAWEGTLEDLLEAYQ